VTGRETAPGCRCRGSQIEATCPCVG